jgi:hypothetical protein
MVRSTFDTGRTERRAAPRHSCSPEALCRVVDLLDQTAVEAGVWDAGVGGACVVIEPHYPAGARVGVDLRHPGDEDGLRSFAEVVHTILVPSHREMWLTGCSFQGAPLPFDELEPYVA